MDRTSELRALIRARMQETGTVRRVRLDELDPYDARDHDDDEDTDHLARLSDPEWLGRVLALGRDRWDISS